MASEQEDDPTSDEEELVLDVAGALGASESTSTQVLSVYVPSRDRAGNEIADQRWWVLEVAARLALVGGGVTIMPPVEGGWVDETGEIVWEQPVVVYTYVKPDAFLAELPALRELLHRMGRGTDQGEVAVEFDGRFYRITDFDEAEGD